MRIRKSIAAPVMLLCGLVLGAAEPSVVRGRIDIRNSKIRLRGGGTDAGGVAVWLTPLLAGPGTGTAVRARAIIEQRDKRFVPHVLAIETGTAVDFPNGDPFFHNVFSTFDGKIFDLGLYANGESRPVRFNRPGVSYIFCNIHPQMSAVIVTVDTPYFATSGPDGSFVMRNVPLGRYELRLWHERSEPRELAALSRVVAIDSPVTDLGIIGLDEAGYVSRGHKNKHGEDYPPGRELPGYRRP